MLVLGYYDYHQIFKPEVVKYIKDTTGVWHNDIVKIASDIIGNNEFFMQPDVGTLESSGASGTGTRPESLTFDPLGIIEVDIPNHKVIFFPES